MAELTPKQERFANEYLIDLNATQAAIRAGFSEKTARSIGQRLLTNVDIQEEIKKRKQERAERVEITQDDVIKDLQDLKDKCLGRKKVRKTYYGEDTNSYIFDPAGAAKALELLGKHLGMFEDRLKVSGNVPVVISGEGDLED